MHVTEIMSSSSSSTTSSSGLVTTSSSSSVRPISPCNLAKLEVLNISIYLLPCLISSISSIVVRLSLSAAVVHPNNYLLVGVSLAMGGDWVCRLRFAPVEQFEFISLCPPDYLVMDSSMGMLEVSLEGSNSRSTAVPDVLMTWRR